MSGNLTRESGTSGIVSRIISTIFMAHSPHRSFFPLPTSRCAGLPSNTLYSRISFKASHLDRRRWIHETTSCRKKVQIFANIFFKCRETAPNSWRFLKVHTSNIGNRSNPTPCPRSGREGICLSGPKISKCSLPVIFLLPSEYAPLF